MKLIHLVCADFMPRVGGVARCGFELAAEISKTIPVEVFTALHPDAAIFDKEQSFKVSRLKAPRMSFLTGVLFGVQLFKKWRSSRPDLVICLLWLPDGLALLIANGLLRISGRKPLPYLVFVHGVEILETKRNWKKRLRRLAIPLKRAVLKNARKVIAVSNYTKKLLVEKCEINESKIAVIHNGCRIDTPKNEGPTINRLFPSSRVILTVARLEDYKGIDRVLSALRVIRSEIPNILYVVCGTGPDLERLRNLVRFWDLDTNVKFLGKVTELELQQAYLTAECFILMTREDLETPNVEGFGIVLLEAALAKLPIIASCHGGIPDAVDGETAGWLVDPLNDKEILQAIRVILADPKSAKVRGLRAYQRAISDFTWAKTTEKVLQCAE